MQPVELLASQAGLGLSLVGGLLACILVILVSKKEATVDVKLVAPFVIEKNI
jgi:hypothetical protein